MDKLGLIARILLGLIFFVFGLNGLLMFMPMPELTEQAGALMGALAATGYFFPVLKITEIVAGALLLAGLFVPLALILLAPIVVQIFLFHIALEPGGMIMAIVIVVLEAYLGFVVYKDSFAGILQAKPDGDGDAAGEGSSEG